MWGVVAQAQEMHLKALRWLWSWAWSLGGGADTTWRGAPAICSHEVPSLCLWPWREYHGTTFHPSIMGIADYHQFLI